MTAATARRTNRERFDGAVRYGQLQLAVAVLGNAIISHHDGSYLVNEFTGGRFLVRAKTNGLACATCDSDNDDHASLVRLYLARIGQHGLGA